MTDNNQFNEENEYQEDFDDSYEQRVRRSGKRNLLPNKNRKRNIGFGLILLLALVFGLYYYNSHTANRSETNMTSEEIDESSYTGSNIMRVDLNQVSKININLETADVRIQKSNTNPYVEYTHLYKGEENVYSLDVSYENGELNLKSDIKGDKLNMKNKIQIVRIFLPNDKPIDEIKAVVDAGDVKITDLEARNLDLKVRSGHITFDNSFFAGSVSNEVGDIILNKTELLNTALKTNVGDIVITEGKLGQKSDFETQSGDIIIQESDGIGNYNIKAGLDVGNFILGNISYRNIKDGFMKDNKANKEISLRTKVGDIVFNKGEGAILDEEEYITNDRVREKEQSEYEYINVPESEEEDQEVIESEDELLDESSEDNNEGENN